MYLVNLFVLIVLVLLGFNTQAAVQEVGLPSSSVNSIKDVIKNYSYSEKYDSTKRAKKSTPSKKTWKPTPSRIIKKHNSVRKTKKRASGKFVSRKKSAKINVPRMVISSQKRMYRSVDEPPKFDLPITYNSKVRKWIKYYQTKGKNWFKNRLERSSRYLPVMKDFLRERGMPEDLAYIAMIESGFSAKAISSANAVGYWQFIKPTANRYGLQTKWWIDERRDFKKSTLAAAAYLGDLYGMFRSWYLTAASYNMGEGRTGRLIRKHGTSNFWELSRKKGFPKETREYIPKLIACMLIAKAPGLYGFNNLKHWTPHQYEYYSVPGGTDLHNLAKYLGVAKKQLMKLNPELLKGLIPRYVSYHRIRVPKGLTAKMANFIRMRNRLAKK